MLKQYVFNDLKFDLYAIKCILMIYLLNSTIIYHLCRKNMNLYETSVKQLTEAVERIKPTDGFYVFKYDKYDLEVKIEQNYFKKLVLDRAVKILEFTNSILDDEVEQRTLTRYNITMKTNNDKVQCNIKDIKEIDIYYYSWYNCLQAVLFWIDSDMFEDSVIIEVFILKEDEKNTSQI